MYKDKLHGIYSVTQISSSTNRHPYGRHLVAQKVNKSANF